jgi:hypothetical protein
MSVKIIRHRTFWFFFIHFFFTVILFVYTVRIFLSIFTDEYYNGMFSQNNLVQFSDRNTLLVCLFVFANFLVVKQMKED